MGHLVLTFSLLLFTFILQGQQVGFKKLYSGEITSASFVDILWDGEKVIATGQFLTDTSSIGLNGLLYMELDTNGNILSTNIYFEPNNGVSSSIGNTIMGLWDGRKVVMTQIYNDTSVLLNTYENGMVASSKKYPIASLNAWLYNLSETDNSILLVGRLANYHYLSEGLIIKTDKIGNKTWEKHYEVPNLDVFLGEPYVIDNNTILIPGSKTYWNPNGPIENNWTKSWVFAIDSIGNKKWEWESEKNTETGVAHRIHHLANGNWLYASSEFIPMPGQIDDWGTRPKLVCRDSNFNLVWERYLTAIPAKGNYTRSLTPTTDGNFVLVGRWNTNNWMAKSVIHKFSESGDSIWTYFDNCEPLSGCDQYLGGITVLESGSIISAGYVQDFDNFKTYGLLIKLNKDGCMDNIDCNLTGAKEILEVQKFRIYPNPTSDVISIEKPIGQTVQLINIRGQLIGEYKIDKSNIKTIDLSSLQSGTYFLKMSEGVLNIVFKVIKI